MWQNYSEIIKLYPEIRPRIESRLRDFEEIWLARDHGTIFKELVFCLFTPQSKARICWETVEELEESGLLTKGCKEEISDGICRVRFRHNKAGYVVELREKFGPSQGIRKLTATLDSLPDNSSRRRWLVENVKGLGYKEGSHFLRNIGLGDDIAILDRHILRNLERYGVIEMVPGYLTPGEYMEIEERMSLFADHMGIPMSHLDFVFWYKETGDIFK